MPVFQRNNHMLWFPVHYEGQECSKYVFYTGAVPNQQIEPAMDWLSRHLASAMCWLAEQFLQMQNRLRNISSRCKNSIPPNN